LPPAAATAISSAFLQVLSRIFFPLSLLARPPPRYRPDLSSPILLLLPSSRASRLCILVRRRPLLFETKLCPRIYPFPRRRTLVRRTNKGRRWRRRWQPEAVPAPVQVVAARQGAPVRDARGRRLEWQRREESARICPATGRGTKIVLISRFTLTRWPPAVHAFSHATQQDSVAQACAHMYTSSCI
jgi:hypothetical protein